MSPQPASLRAPACNLGIYVHIPFCIKKCNYCNFYSHTKIDSNYIDKLVNEINAFQDEYTVDTIYFGGGTPTLLPLNRVMTALHNKFNILPNAEISIETNPGIDVDFAALHNLGFSRLSIGTQSIHDDELKILGRIHTHADFLKTYQQAANHFNNISVDIMYSLPNQTLEKWKQTVDTIVDLQPQHISAYALKIEDGTPFASMNLALPTDELDREMYYYVAENSLPRYEISNFGLPCKHNLKYWRCEEYVGFGDGAKSGFKRVSANDRIIFGLRLDEGVSSIYFQKFKKEVEKCLKLGLIEKKNENYVLTARGVDLSNQVFCEFI